MIHINIEIKERKKSEEFFKKFQRKIEDIFFSIIQKLPESLVPRSVMDWVEKYLDKRIAELKHDIVRDEWQTIKLEKVIDDISNMQQDKK